MLAMLWRLLSQNINALFDPPIVEEELINLIGNCVFRIFENPGIALQRMKDVRISLIQVLGSMMSKYGYSLSCRLKIVQSLKHFEHLAVSEKLLKCIHYKRRAFKITDFRNKYFLGWGSNPQKYYFGEG